MLTERRDYLLRLIQQAAAAIRRLREMLTGDASAEDVAREAEESIVSLLGGPSQSQLLERVDAATAVQLLGDAERLRLWIELLRVQADAHVKHGTVGQSERLLSRAAALEAAGSRLNSR
ncbi:MAG TPA: hypothetical protein VJ717_03670 [Gemmatimonadaceae bacterium]|nr:hypothetical protein [Gemmatimonadaceae bacterium]